VHHLADSLTLILPMVAQGGMAVAIQPEPFCERLVNLVHEQVMLGTVTRLVGCSGATFTVSEHWENGVATAVTASQTKKAVRLLVLKAGTGPATHELGFQRGVSRAVTARGGSFVTGSAEVAAIVFRRTEVVVRGAETAT